MTEKMEEYQRPRSHISHKKKSESSHSYTKKLIKQLIVASLLFVMLCPPDVIGSELSAKIRAASKSALTYEISTESITSAIKQFFPKKPKKETEVPKNGATSQNTENL